MRLPILLSIVFSIIAADGVSGPISPNFNLWLTANGYESEDFLRADYGTQGSYGGMSSTINRTSNTPVIFCHGNTDTALKTDSFSTGWDATILYFLANGYTQADLYATSWSDNKKANAGKRTHSCFEVTRLRKWVDAVLKYTGSPKVSMVSHSMGVTLMRKVIKGGTITDPDGSTCNLGPGISQQIEVFVGLSGANYGMCNCEGGSAFAEASCNKKNGFWPGDYCGLNSLTCGLHPLPYPCTPSTGVIYSNYLTLLNNDPTKEGDYVFSAWSLADDVIQYQDMTWGHPSSLIPTSTDHKIYQKLTHMQTKEQTYADQYTMVHDKRVPQ